MPLKCMTDNSRIAADQQRFRAAKIDPKARAASARAKAVAASAQPAEDDELRFPDGLGATGISSPQAAFDA